MEAHDLTSPVIVARTIGSRWTTEDKIYATSKIAFMIMNACSTVKLSYSDIDTRFML